MIRRHSSYSWLNSLTTIHVNNQRRHHVYATISQSDIGIVILEAVVSVPDKIRLSP